MATSMERQQWMEAAVKAFRVHFAENGWIVPEKVRVSVGIPKGMHGSKKAIGQCWSDMATSDGYFEIFSSPEQGHEKDHLETLGHELVHATVGTKEGHKGKFKECALAVGFAFPMTTTPSGPKMAEFIKHLINSIGFYPAGSLDISQRKKKGTYMLKCECPDCGMIVRTTAKWIEARGTPVCQADGVPMEEE